MVTTLGQISFSRYSLIPPNAHHREKLIEISGVRSIFPMDCYLGIANLPFRITPSAMLKIAYWAQNQCSYQRAEEALYEIMRIKINDDTIRHVSNYVGNVIFNNDCAKATEAYSSLCSDKLPFPKNRNGVLYIQADGAALNTRSKDDMGSTWRENKLGEVFSSNDIRYWTDKKGKRQHQIIRKEYISYVGSAEEFKKHLLACAIRSGYGHFKETVFIGDGAAWLRNMVSDLFPDAQQILDFYHLCENVHTFAKCLFGTEDAKFKLWAKDICDSLRASQYNQVLKELSSFKGKKLNGCPVNLHGYISNNINHINYVEYEKKGYFIGSGAIESGNKIVLHDRLKRAGMRWNTATAQAMLTLRSKAESNRWFIDVEKPFLRHCMALI